MSIFIGSWSVNVAHQARSYSKPRKALLRGPPVLDSTTAMCQFDGALGVIIHRFVPHTRACRCGEKKAGLSKETASRLRKINRKPRNAYGHPLRS